MTDSSEIPERWPDPAELVRIDRIQVWEIGLRLVYRSRTATAYRQAQPHLTSDEKEGP